MNVRVAVADDQPLVLEGFSTVVSRAPDMELVGRATDGEEAVRLAREAGAAVVCATHDPRVIEQADSELPLDAPPPPHGDRTPEAAVR